MHQVKPWFEGRLDFAPVLAFDGDEEFPLLGGSVALFRDRNAAAFQFRHRLHRITLLVFRAEAAAALPNDGAQRSHTRSRGFDVVLWRRDDLGYALVSDMNGADLDRLASKIAGAYVTSRGSL
jgi:anti-sigma factor RsiW